MRKQLILDAGGVIVTNFTPAFWERMAEASGMRYEELRAVYKAEVRDSLWNGRLPEPEFWNWLERECPAVPSSDARALLRNHIAPLPASACIPAWSEQADVHILSNHRAEWLEACLAPFRSRLGHVVVSSEAGSSKPSAAIFEHLQAKLPASSRGVLYVDDLRKNTEAAERCGWETLIADAESAWIERVNEWLQEG